MPHKSHQIVQCLIYGLPCDRHNDPCCPSCKRHKHAKLQPVAISCIQKERKWQAFRVHCKNWHPNHDYNNQDNYKVIRTTEKRRSLDNRKKLMQESNLNQQTLHNLKCIKVLPSKISSPAASNTMLSHKASSQSIQPKLNSFFVDNNKDTSIDTTQNNNKIKLNINKNIENHQISRVLQEYSIDHEGKPNHEVLKYLKNKINNNANVNKVNKSFIDKLTQDLIQNNALNDKTLSTWESYLEDNEYDTDGLLYEFENEKENKMIDTSSPVLNLLQSLSNKIDHLENKISLQQPKKSMIHIITDNKEKNHYLQNKRKQFKSAKCLESLLIVFIEWLTYTHENTLVYFSCFICKIAGKKCKLAGKGICCTIYDIYNYTSRFQKLRQSLLYHDTECDTHYQAISKIKRNKSLQHLVFKKRGRIAFRNLLFGGSDLQCLRNMHCQIDNGIYLGEDGLRTTHQITKYKTIMHQQVMANTQSKMKESYLFGGPRYFSSSLDKRAQMNMGLCVHNVYTVVRGKMKGIPMLFSKANAEKGHTDSGKDCAEQHYSAFSLVGLDPKEGLLITTGDGVHIKHNLETHMRNIAKLLEYYKVEWDPDHQLMLIDKEIKKYTIGIQLKGYDMAATRIIKKIKTSYQQCLLKAECEKQGIPYESTKNYSTTRWSKFRHKVSRALNTTYSPITVILEKIDKDGAFIIVKSFAFVYDNNFSLDYTLHHKILEKYFEDEQQFSWIQIKAIFQYQNTLQNMINELETTIVDANHIINDQLFPYLSFAQQQLCNMSFHNIELLDNDYIDGDTLDFAGMLDNDFIAEEMTDEYNKMIKFSKQKHTICTFCKSIWAPSENELWIECNVCYGMICNECSKLPQNKLSQYKDNDEYTCKLCLKRNNINEENDDVNDKEYLEDACLDELNQTMQQARNIIMTRSKTKELASILENNQNIHSMNHDQIPLTRGQELFRARCSHSKALIEFAVTLLFDKEIGVFRESRWKKWLPYYCQNIFDIKFIMKSIKRLIERKADSKIMEEFLLKYLNNNKKEFDSLITFVLGSGLKIVPLLPDAETLFNQLIRLVFAVKDLTIQHPEWDEFDITEQFYEKEKYALNMAGILKIWNASWCSKIMESFSEKLLKIMGIHYTKSRNKLQYDRLNEECQIHALGPEDKDDETCFLDQFASICMSLGMKCVNVDRRSNKHIDTHYTLGRHNQNTIPFDDSTVSTELLANIKSDLNKKKNITKVNNKKNIKLKNNKISTKIIKLKQYKKKRKSTKNKSKKKRKLTKNKSKKKLNKYKSTTNKNKSSKKSKERKVSQSKIPFKPKTIPTKNKSESSNKSKHELPNKSKPKTPNEIEEHLSNQYIQCSFSESQINGQLSELKNCNMEKQCQKYFKAIPIQEIYNTLITNIQHNKHLSKSEKKQITSINPLKLFDASLTIERFLQNHKQMIFMPNGHRQCSYITFHTMISLCNVFVDTLESYSNYTNTIVKTKAYVVRLLCRIFHICIWNATNGFNQKATRIYALYLNSLTYFYQKHFGLHGSQNILTIIKKFEDLFIELEVFRSLLYEVQICVSCKHIYSHTTTPESFIHIKPMVNNPHFLSSTKYQSDEKCPKCSLKSVLLVQRRDISDVSLIFMDHLMKDKFNLNHLNNLIVICKNGVKKLYKSQSFGYFIHPTTYSLGHYKTMQMITVNHQQTIFEYESLSNKIQPIKFKISGQNISCLMLQKKGSSTLIFDPSSIDICVLGSDNEITDAWLTYFQSKEDVYLSPSVDICKQQLLDICCGFWYKKISSQRLFKSKRTATKPLSNAPKPKKFKCNQ